MLRNRLRRIGGSPFPSPRERPPHRRLTEPLTGNGSSHPQMHVLAEDRLQTAAQEADVVDRAEGYARAIAQGHLLGLLGSESHRRLLATVTRE